MFNELNWRIALPELFEISEIFKMDPLSKSNSTVMLGVFPGADAIKTPFRVALAVPLVRQFPKSS